MESRFSVGSGDLDYALHDVEAGERIVCGDVENERAMLIRSAVPNGIRIEAADGPATLLNAVDQHLSYIRLGQHMLPEPKILRVSTSFSGQSGYPSNSGVTRVQKKRKIEIGSSRVEVDANGNVTRASVGAFQTSFRADDGRPGKMLVSCPAGHPLSVQMPSITQSFSCKVFNVRDPCPLCGGAVSAPGGYYVRNGDSVFERLTGMPS